MADADNTNKAAHTIADAPAVVIQTATAALHTAQETAAAAATLALEKAHEVKELTSNLVGTAVDTLKGGYETAQQVGVNTIHYAQGVTASTLHTAQEATASAYHVAQDVAGSVLSKAQDATVYALHTAQDVTSYALHSVEKTPTTTTTTDTTTSGTAPTGNVQTIGDSPLVTENLPDRPTPADPQTPWPNLVGAKDTKAEAEIQRINPNIKVQIVPVDSFVTQEYDANRVRLFVDKDSFVVRQPIIG